MNSKYSSNDKPSTSVPCQRGSLEFFKLLNLICEFMHKYCGHECSISFICYIYGSILCVWTVDTIHYPCTELHHKFSRSECYRVKSTTKVTNCSARLPQKCQISTDTDVSTSQYQSFYLSFLIQLRPSDYFRYQEQQKGSLYLAPVTCLSISCQGLKKVLNFHVQTSVTLPRTYYQF